MTLTHTLLFYLHVTAGSLALPLFWVPVIARKGSFNHRRFGRWFARLMYAVAGSGLLMAGMDLTNPLVLHAPGLEAGTAAAAEAATEIRGWALFLLSLSVLVLATTRHGWLVINHRNRRDVLRAPVHQSLLTGLLVAGAALLTTGLLRGEVLMIIFGLFESILATSMFHYSYKKQLAPREWWVEHLGGLIGSGIGAYTAFFVFGGTRLLESLFGDAYSDAGLVLWIAPGVIGGVAIGLLTRHYRRRFAGRAEAGSAAS